MGAYPFFDFLSSFSSGPILPSQWLSGSSTGLFCTFSYEQHVGLQYGVKL